MIEKNTKENKQKKNNKKTTTRQKGQEALPACLFFLWARPRLP